MNFFFWNVICNCGISNSQSLNLWNLIISTFFNIYLFGAMISISLEKLSIFNG